MRGTFAVIDTAAIQGNVAAIRAVLRPGTQMLVAVKAGGYGHGALQAATAAIAGGADALGVASLEEGMELRHAGIRVPILVFGRVPATRLEVAAREQIAVTLTSDWSREDIPRCTPALQVHLKIDTGMGRLGFRDVDDALRMARWLKSRSDLDLCGLYSHLACADDLESSHAEGQAERFRAVVARFQQEGLCPALVHLTNSAGTLRESAWHYDMVRVGVSAYGLPPSPDFPMPVKLEQALHLYAVVQRLAWIDIRETVGYGAAFTANRRTRVATLPIGYADGYQRALSNRGTVLIRGRAVPVIGKVCMDQMMVDVTDLRDVTVGDVATVYGRVAPTVWDGGALQMQRPENAQRWILESFVQAKGQAQALESPEQGVQTSQRVDLVALTDVARAAGTISYELMCALASRVPRLYTGLSG